MHTSITGGEPLHEAAARRLRGVLAEMRLSQKDLAQHTGWGRAYLYRRLTGETPLDVADLEAIQTATGISAAYLVSGDEPKAVSSGKPPPPTSGLWIRRSAA